jgi:hypothetical protein
MLSFSTTADAFVLSEDTASKIAGIDIAVAGRPHDYKVTVTHVDASCASVTSTDYTGSHALKLWRTDSNGSWTAPTVVSPALTVPSAQPASSNITLNFTSGVASFNLGTTDIGRYTLSLLDDTQSYTSAPLSGSSNALTVRPFALVISHLICTYSFNGTRTNNINLGTTTGTPFCLAGGYFSAAVGAYRRSSSMTSNGTDANDDGVPDSTATWTNVTSGGLATSFNSPVTLKALAGSQTPSTGDLGTLDNGSVSGFSGGKATPTDLRYTEAGLFQLDSQSLVIDYLGSGLALNGSLFTVGTTPTSTSTFGRFAPARFAASNASVTLRSLSSCSPAEVSPILRALRSRTSQPNESSSRFSCIDTADCVRFKNPAARVTPPASATATKERREVRSRLRAISQILMGYVKTIHFCNVPEPAKRIK